MYPPMYVPDLNNFTYVVNIWMDNLHWVFEKTVLHPNTSVNLAFGSWKLRFESNLSENTSIPENLTLDVKNIFLQTDHELIISNDGPFELNETRNQNGVWNSLF